MSDKNLPSVKQATLLLEAATDLFEKLGENGVGIKIDKNLPSVKQTALTLEAAIDTLFELQGQPVIYRPTSELLKLDPEPPFCSFCGKGSNQVTQMIPGKDANICDQCVMFCFYGFSLEEQEKPVIYQPTSELLKCDLESILFR